MQFKRRQALFQIDWWLLTPVLFLVTVSLTVLFSIDPAFFRNQFLALGISCVFFFFFSQFRFNDLLIFYKPLYFICITSLLIVLVIGYESRGAVRWIEILGFSLQLSEICKPFLTICFAYFLSQRGNRDLKTYVLAMTGLLPIWLLIYKQPDLGNALIYAIVVIGTFIVYGLPWLWLGIASAIFLISSPFFGKCYMIISGNVL